MEKRAAEQAVILIPSLEPDEKLPAYIRKLKEGGFPCLHAQQNQYRDKPFSHFGCKGTAFFPIVQIYLHFC